jgi:hypothetical protein
MYRAKGTWRDSDICRRQDEMKNAIGIWKTGTRTQLGPLQLSQFRGDAIAYASVITVKNST